MGARSRLLLRKDLVLVRSGQGPSAAPIRRRGDAALSERAAGGRPGVTTKNLLVLGGVTDVRGRQ